MSEDDAVAAYLARERAALGEDADMFSGSGAPASGGMDSFPDLDDFSAPTPAASQPAQQTQQSNDLLSPASEDPMAAFPSFDAPASNGNEFKVTRGVEGERDEERERFESSFPDLSGEASAVETIPYGATPYPSQPYATQTTQQTSNYTSILPPPSFPSLQTEEDSPAIKAWREKQAAEIKERDEESKRKKEEVVLKAEKAIDSFYERYNEQKERSIKENKENEKTFLESLQESISKGTAWERITDLIDLQNSQSKTLRASVPGGSDLARMKEILLSLRREGDKAPAAAGY